MKAILPNLFCLLVATASLPAGTPAAQASAPDVRAAGASAGFLAKSSADIRTIIAQENERRKTLAAAVEAELKAEGSAEVTRDGAASVSSRQTDAPAKREMTTTEWVAAWSDWHASHAREVARELAAQGAPIPSNTRRQDLSTLVAAHEEKLRIIDELAQTLATANEAEARSAETNFANRLARLQSPARKK